MSFKSNAKTVGKTKPKNLLTEIIAKCSGSGMPLAHFLKIAHLHVSVYANYLEKVKEKGPAAFPNRLEYQKFQVAKVFLDKLNILEFNADPTFKGFQKYQDIRSPPLDAYSMTPDLKEERKLKFCNNIDRGDILHLKVVEESESEYKLLVINKYNENERVVDYSIHAYMIKSCLLDVLPRRLKISDFVRAAVLGKLKTEENCFSKLLVSVNDSSVKTKYQDVLLGILYEHEIPFYPGNMSEHSSYINYLKTNCPDDLQETMKCMNSIGIDPYKTYSFHGPSDGEKLGIPKMIDTSSLESFTIKLSMKCVREAEEQLVNGAPLKSVRPKLAQALKTYPNNDVAYAIKGQLYKKIYKEEKRAVYFRKTIYNLENSLKLNAYNLIATREYLSILLMSADMFRKYEDTEKANEIMQTYFGYSCVVDVVKALVFEEGISEQPVESEGPAAPMDH